MRKLRLIALAVVPLLTTLPTPARAEPRAFVTLEYEIAPSADGCPDADEFRRSVARQLGYDPFRESADRRVSVQIQREDSRFQGRIRWSDARGSWVGDRQLSSEHPDCREIAANVVFAVAVEVQLIEALSGGSTQGAPPPAMAPPRPAKPAPAVRASSPTRSSPTPRSSAATANPLTLGAGLGPFVGLGLAPQPMGGGRIFLSARFNRVSLETDFDGALPVSQHRADGSGFTLHRFAGEGAVCGHVRPVAGCLTAAFGRLEAQGFGVDAPASSAGFFSQIGARLTATVDFSDRYFASVHVEPLVTVSRWKVLLNDSTAWTTPRLSVLLGLTFGTRFF